MKIESIVRSRLERITLKGFKTIHELIDFEPRSRTVLIGPNGAGKSNFISFFRMMSWALSGPDKLALHVSLQGGSRRLLHDGPAHTREIEAELTIRTAVGENEYAFRLFHAAGGTLVFADERYRFSRAERQSKATWKALGAGHKDPQLLTAAVEDQGLSRSLLNFGWRTPGLLYERRRRSVSACVGCGHLCYATSATTPSGGASASRAPTRCCRSR